jgi:amidase
MKKMGATLVDPVNLPEEVLNNMGGIYATISDLDFKWHLAEYLAAQGPNVPVKTLSEVISISKILAYSQTPVDKTVFERIRKSEARGPLTDPFYLRTLEHGPTMVKNAILKILNDHRLDAIIFPTNSCPQTVAFHSRSRLQMWQGFGKPRGLASHSGFPRYPSAGFSRWAARDLPSWGPHIAKPMLIRLAYSYEQATKHRRPPKRTSLK